MSSQHPDDHEALRASLGAYVLGALSIEETQRVEAHVAGCAACRADLAEIVPVARALADARAATPPGERVDPASLPDHPPADLGARVADRVLADARGDAAAGAAGSAGSGGGRARLGAGTLAAVAGAAAAAVVVVGLAITRPDPAPPAAAPVVPTEPVVLAVDDPRVDADADLVNHTWGVEVELVGTGFDLGERYRVVMLDERGRRSTAGAFVGTGDAEMTCSLNSAVLRESAAGFEVLDERGELVASSTFA